MEHIGSLMATMGIDIAQAEKNIAKIEKDVKEYAKTVKTEFTKIEKEFTQSGSVFKKYTDTVDKEINGVKKNLVALEKQYKTLATSANSNLGKIEDKVKNHGNVLNATLKTVRAAVLGYVTVLATTKIVDFTKGIITAGVELDSFERSLVAITKSQKQATYEFDFVNKVAKDYGLNLQALRQSYLGLLASTQETNLAGEETRRLFIVTSAAASVLGKSTEDAQGMMRAFIQMISKGTVQAEELRGQLGDRLYGAFNKAAKAMGYSTEELNKNLKKGDVLAEDLIPKLVRLLEGDFLEAAKKAGDGPRASFEKLNTSILNIQEAIANSGVLDSFVDLARETSEWVNTNKKLLAQDFGPFFEAIAFGGKVALAVVGGLANKFSQLAKIGGFAAELIEGSTDAIEVTKTRITELQQRLMEVYSGYNFISKETQKQRDIEIAQIKRQIKIYEEVLSKFENKAINLKIDTNLEEEFGEIDHLFNELVVKSKLAQDKLQGNTDKLLEKEIKATRKALDKIIADRKKAYETLLKQQEKYREDISEYLDTYNLSDYDKKLYYLEKEVQAFKEAGLQEIDYAEYIAAKKQEIDNDYYEQQQKEADKLAKIQQDAYDDLYDTMKGYTRDVIDDFDNMGDTLVGIAKNIAKDLAAAFLTQNIVMPITLAVGSSIGLTGSGGVPYSALSGVGGGSGATDGFSLLSNINTGYNALTGGISSSVEGFLSSGVANKIGAGLFGASAWGGAAAPTYLSGAGGSMISVNSGLAGGAISGGVGSSTGIVGTLSAAAPWLAGAAVLAPIVMSMLESEPEPRIGIRKGDISEFGYNPTTKDMSNQGPINDYIVDYYDAYFTAIDDLTSNTVKSVLADTKWERLRVHPEDFDSVEEALFAVNDKIFDTFADGFISGLAGGQLDGYLDESFFNDIRSENESLLDTFVRFGTVISETDGFVDQFKRQVDEFGETTSDAYQNVLALTSTLNQIETGVSGIVKTSSINALDNLTDSWHALIDSLKDVNASVDDLAAATAGRSTVIGSNITGLTANSIQTSLASGNGIDSIIQSAIQGAGYAEIAEIIAEEYVSAINQEIGDVWISSGGDLQAVLSAMQDIDTTGVQSEIQALQKSFGLLEGSITKTTQNLKNAAYDLISAYESKISTLQNRFDLLQNNVDIARDNYLDALDREINVQQELKDVADDTANSLFNIIESLGLSKIEASGVSSTTQWNSAIGSAMGGNMDAMSSLSSIYSGVLDEALAGASSREEYQNTSNMIAMQLGLVRDVAKESMEKQESASDSAQDQIDLLTDQSNFIQGIDTNVLSLLDAQYAYNDAMLALEQSGLEQQISIYESQLSELERLNENVLSLADARINYADARVTSSGGGDNTKSIYKDLVSGVYTDYGLGTPDIEGLNYWVDQLSDSSTPVNTGNIYTAIANAAEERGVNVPAFGTGGTVSSPTFALVGESGVEHITPDSQMTGVKKELSEIKKLLVDIARSSQSKQNNIYELLDDVVNGYSSVNTEAVTA